MKNSVCLKRMLVILFFGCQALFAQAVTFYFLPPYNDSWMAGNSYIKVDGENEPELMNIDARCGWFKKTYDSRADVPERIMIYLGSQGKDKLDLNGTGADASDPAWIPLRARFGTSLSLYIYQDPSSTEDGLTIRTNAPGNLGEEAAGRCSYKMAAIIYDTDNSVNPSFYGTSTIPSGATYVIRKGIVKPDLDTITRKPVFNTDTKSGWTKESFEAAFTPKALLNGKESNVPKCYDMPFGRATNGTWEFDSDNMRPPNPAGTTNLVGGFFPYILDSAYTATTTTDGSNADYDECPTCRKEYAGNCFNRLGGTDLTNLEVTWRDSTYKGANAFDRTYFADGTGLGGYYGGAAGCTSLRPGFDGATKSRANFNFCFESHADFTYEKGQEFFFRGDDDIWVFINNRLVIDLGGYHNAAPGYVDLDTIKTPKPLVPGDKYPIDIFFCERMVTQSNVRVSTNMYITQKSAFTNSIENAYTENQMCASILSGNDCAAQMSGSSGSRKEMCAEQLRENNYTVDFYMVNRSNSKDTTWLSPAKNNENCQGTATEFTCYAKDGVGITVKDAIYSCGGRYQCKGSQKALDKIDIPPGSYIVYARLMENGKQVPNTSALNIDNLKGPTNARIAWGTLSNSGDVLHNAYGEETKREQSVIAGKITPIYIAVGNWENKSYTTFDERELEDTDVIKYSLSITGNGADEIDVYADERGKQNATFPREIPLSGIDTVWVKCGSFEMGEQTLEINLAGAVSTSEETPSLKLKIYQPRLRFTKTGNTDNLAFWNNARPNTASGYKMWDQLPPYVLKPLEVYIVALDTNRDEICEHCTFPLYQESFVNTEGNSKGIVTGSPLKIENGKQTTYIKGQDIVEGKDYAQWHINGPSKEYTWAKWDSLQFRDAPIPMPSLSELHDRNGDGIGDSLVIKFGKPFKSGGKIIDSLLPILVEVTWEKGYTVAFHSSEYAIDKLKDGNYVRDNLYNKAFFDRNHYYWEKYLVGDSLIIIADSTITFSKGILTSGYNSGSGKLVSYTPYYDKSQCGKSCTSDAFMWREGGYEAAVVDRVSPIVVRAQFKLEEEKKCGSNKDDACRELLVAYLSEPIFAAPNADKDPLAIGNPFSYCFEYSQQPKSKCSEGKGIADSERHSLKWDNNLTWKWELPQDKPNSEDISYSATYKPNNKPYPKEYYENVVKGDSIVELIYYSYKYDEDSTTRMPKAYDWIKIRPPSSAKSGFDVFYDAAGNSASPRERGVLISGKNQNRYEKDKVVLAGISDTTTTESPVFGGVFENKNMMCKIPGHYRPEVCAGWMSDDAKRYADDHLYNTKDSGHVAAFLPVSKDITNAKEAGAHYQGSVGTIFSSIKGGVDEFLNTYCQEHECRDSTGKELLTRENIAKYITLQASVYYHTNLGNYTAHRNPVSANCTDKVFLSDLSNSSVETYGNNCLGNEYGFYLAWNLKTNKNRFVGTGAYVAITKFYWQIRFEEDGNLKTKKFNPDEFVELFGVHRSKSNDGS